MSALRSRWKARIRRHIVSGTCLATLATTFMTGPAHAAPTLDAHVEDVRRGLISLGKALSAAAEQPALAQELPLTASSVRNVLTLDSVVAGLVEQALIQHPDTTLDSLHTAFDDPRLRISKASGAPTGSQDWTLRLALEEGSTAPLKYQDERLIFGTGKLDGQLAASMTATMKIRFTEAESRLRRFAIVGDSDIDVRVWTREGDESSDSTRVDVDEFEVADGFVAMTASGSAQIDASTSLRMRDPNGRDLITDEDMTLSAASELFATRSTPGAGDVEFELDVRSDIAEDAQGQVSVVAASDPAAAPYGKVKVTRNEAMEELAQLTRTSALSGFTQYVTALQSLEQSADQQLPLLDVSLRDVYSPADQLLGVVASQATASIVCGSADTSPPSGTPAPGEAQYCQATMTGADPTSGKITWDSPDDSVTFEPAEDAPGTVGRSPVANVKVMGADAFTPLSVTFENEQGQPQTASTPVRSIQALGDEVARLGLGGQISYDRGTQRFEVRVRQDSDAEKTHSVKTGGNGNLAPLTGLNGLCQAVAGIEPRECSALDGADQPAGDAQVKVRDRKIHADFGIGVPPVTGQGQAPGDAVFYLRPGNDGTVYKVGKASGSMAGQAKMLARIGFLQVDVDVTEYALDSDSDAARVSIDDESLALPGGESIDDVVGVSTILGLDPLTSDSVHTHRGLSARASLTVRDAPLGAGAGRPINAEGTVDVDWPTLDPQVLPTASTDGEYDALRLLDIVPSRQGVMTEGTQGVRIKDASADFVTQYGIDPSAPEAERTVDRRLHDLSIEGSSSTLCSQFAVVSATELDCLLGPLADTAEVNAGRGVAPGHRYLIEGDPDALRDVIVENLAGIHTNLTVTDPKLGADRTFGLFDVLPAEIGGARLHMGQALGSLNDAITASGSAEDDTATASGISSLQAFSTRLGKELADAAGDSDVNAHRPAFDLKVGAHPRLEIDVESKGSDVLRAPVRVATDTAEVRIYDGSGDDTDVVKVPLRVASSASYGLGVDLATGKTSVRGNSGISEQITSVDSGANVGALLGERSVDYGSARVQSGDAGDVELKIGVGASTVIGDDADEWIDAGQVAAHLSHTRRVLGDGQQCQGVGGLAKDKTAACLALPLKIPAAPDAEDQSAQDSFVHVALGPEDSSGGSGGSVEAQPIAYRFLGEGLAGLKVTLTDALNGDNTSDDDGLALTLPLVGTDLDAVADVPESVGLYAGRLRAALTAAEQDIAEDADLAELEQVLGDAFEVAAARVTSEGLSASISNLRFACTPVCGQESKVANVQKIDMDVKLQGQSADNREFVLGPAGATVVSDQEIPSTASWTLDASVGIARGEGPYVQLATDSDDGPRLSVDVDARLPDFEADACQSWGRHGRWQGVNASAPSIGDTSIGASDAEVDCLNAYVGKFPAVLVDRPGNDGGTHLNATVDVTLADGPAQTAGRAYLPAFYDKDVEFETSTSGTGALSVYFESFAAKAGFFDVAGALDLRWEDGAYDSEGLTYGHLTLDLTSLSNAVLPGFDKAKKYLAPLNPVVDQLTAPIPVVSDLMKMAGKDPVTALSLLTNKFAPINFLLNLMQLQNIVAGGPEDGVDLRPIGQEGLQGFMVKPMVMHKFGKCTETGTLDGKPYTRSNDGNGESGRCEMGNMSNFKAWRKGELPPRTQPGLKISKTESTNPYFSLPSVSFPILQDTAQVEGLLTGEADATMMYVDLGHAGITKQVTKVFGPLMVGPVPIIGTVGGIVGFDARFAFGFDTRGLSQKIKGLGTHRVGEFVRLTEAGNKPSLFADGFYIDDLEGGVDVPEIKFTFTIQAGASVSIGIASAGITGGVTLDLSLDAVDPNSDGKIYTDEFFGRSMGPACIFDVSAGLTFFLRLFFSIRLIFYTYRKSWDLFTPKRIKLFETTCNQEDPVLAELVDEDSDTPTLKLNMGDRAALRKAFVSEIDESFIVRQLASSQGSPGGVTTLQVSAFQVVQNFAVPANTVVVANADAGRDSIKLHPAPDLSDDSSQDIAPAGLFTFKALIDGGSGDDTIETGDAADHVTGGADNDVIRVNGGNDVVEAGAGDDQVDGGEGHDTLDGGAGNDEVVGGPGADMVIGGAGDDMLDGGKGLSPLTLFGSTNANVVRGLLDSGDLVIGGAGSDTIDGGDGSDLVVGGEYDGPSEFNNNASVRVEGVSGSSAPVSFEVNNIRTVTLPSEAEALAVCRDPGGVGTGDSDSVSGGGDRDLVVGGPGHDNLAGGGGDDIVCGRGGDDLLEGDGDDTDPSEHGDDLVLGGPGADRVYGQGGDDSLRGGSGDDLVRGGDGDDTIGGGYGADLLIGGPGANTIIGDESSSPASDAGSPSSEVGDGVEIRCYATTSVIGGRADLDRDFSANGSGRLEGLRVAEGLVYGPDGALFSGAIDGVVFAGGLIDINRDGTITPWSVGDPGDTGVVPLGSMAGAVGDGDCILGGDDADTSLDGGIGGDYIDAGDGDDTTVTGGVGDDFVRGGNGDDLLHGGAGDDLVAGDAGDDIAFGQAGADVVRGGSGDDLLAGGSSTDGAADGADEVLGDGGHDVVVGGNASLSAEASEDSAIDGVTVALLDTPTHATDADDAVYGGYGNDWVFGGQGRDRAYGGPGDDVIEGGPGRDLVQGDDGSDIVIGGSSTTGAVTLERSAAGADDDNDEVYGDNGVDGQDGSDIVAGDNARIQPADAEQPLNRSRWNRIRPDVEIMLFDVAHSAPAAPVAPSAFGNDTISGGGGNDLIFGQGGHDVISGGDGDDAIEGNGGDDQISGNGGHDELLGGSWTSGALDGDDQITGGAGSDTILGDNGTAINQFVPLRLHDVPTLADAGPDSVFGDDHMVGGDGDDIVFGQSGDDQISGDDGVDQLEGGSGDDVIAGGNGHDVLIGGHSSTDGAITATRTAQGMPDGADQLEGGSGDDVLAGDNARILDTDQTRQDGTRKRLIQLFDLATSKQAAAAGSSAGDTLAGGPGRDLLFGQGGNDVLDGGSDDDYLEGNAGDDTLRGASGEDDLVGGGSTRSGALITSGTDRLIGRSVARQDSSAADLLDGNDRLEGDSERDVLLGDNGRILRAGPNQRLSGGASGTHVIRHVAMADKKPGVWAGSDYLDGGSGDDDLYGQFDNTSTKRAGQNYLGHKTGGDVLIGGSGADALIGDQGVNVPTPASKLGRVDYVVKDKRNGLRETVRRRGTLINVVTLVQPTLGGADVIVAGPGRDSVHAGAGKDVVDAGSGDDWVFGGDGHDALWGGSGHDLVFGGAGNDMLDIKRRAKDPALWHAVAPLEDTDRRRRTMNGRDVLYGGSGADALQADQGDQGSGSKVQGDRLIDWNGKINFYKVCKSGYGPGKVINAKSDALVSALKHLAKSAGAVGSSELALPGRQKATVYPNQKLFVCESS